MLNNKQKTAVDQINGPVLIIAGAGSGKTTTLINRTAHIIDSGAAPESIVLLTFTNKAANEMVSRGEKLLDGRFKKVTACTFHSFCYRLLCAYNKEAGKSDFVVIDQNTAKDTIRMIISKLEGEDARNLPDSAVICSIISAAVNTDQTIETTIRARYHKYSNVEIIESVENIKAVYDNYKKDNFQVDYDDIIINTIKMLENEPELRHRLAQRYKYVMVDEYQDSNSLQLKFLKLLCDNNPNANVCVVGDDQQSIYLFRGAEFLNIINFPREFRGCKTIILDQNYRSNQEILDLANEIIRTAPEKFNKNLEGQKCKGDLPTIIETTDQTAEAKFVVDKTKEYLASGVSLSDIAILSRSSKSSYLIESMLVSEDLPFEKYGGMTFFDRAFVQDICAALKTMINLSDEVAWFRWLSLHPGIGNKSAFTIIYTILDTSDIESLKIHKVKKFLPFAEEFITLYKESQKETFKTIYPKVVKYYFKVRQAQLDSMQKDTRSKIENYNKAVEALKEDIEDTENYLNKIAEKYSKTEEFLSDIALDNTDKTEPTDKITISTIHSAKGLEFKVVFVTDCVEGIFPRNSGRTIYDDLLYKQYDEKSLEEERRVLYVALTRAKDDLYIMKPLHIFPPGKSGSKPKVNRFLTGPIRKKLVNIEQYPKEPLFHV